MTIGVRYNARIRAFTLIESAIVLSVLGLVISGLFYAMNPAVKNVTVNQGADELNTIVSNARAYYAGQNSSYANLTNIHKITQTPDFCYYSPIMSSSAGNVFPPNMLVKGAKNQIANHLWGGAPTCAGTAGSAEIAVACLTGQCADPLQIVVRFNSLPPDICATIILQNSSVAAEVGLNQILVNGKSIGALPATAQEISVACSNSASYTVDWYYGIGG